MEEDCKVRIRDFSDVSQIIIENMGNAIVEMDNVSKMYFSLGESVSSYLDETEGLSPEERSSLTTYAKWIHELSTKCFSVGDIDQDASDISSGFSALLGEEDQLPF